MQLVYYNLITCLLKLFDWSEEWQMTFNVDKCAL